MAGAQVTVAPVYQNCPAIQPKESLRADLEMGRIDMVTFTSSSTVRNFLSMVDAESQDELERLMEGVDIAAIGPITAKTITDNGLQVTVQAEEYTISELVWSIVEYYTKA